MSLLRKLAPCTIQSYVNRVVGALYAAVLLVSDVDWTSTTITIGWSFVAYFVIGATALCLPGLIVLGYEKRLTTWISRPMKSKEM